MTDVQITTDHDLLIELRTEMKGMRADIKTFSDDTKERLASLEAKKVDKDEFSKFLISDGKESDDHERRIRNLERWGWLAIGAITLSEFALMAYLTYRQFHP
jgi:hypothetical protein